VRNKSSLPTKKEANSAVNCWPPSGTHRRNSDSALWMRSNCLIQLSIALKTMDRRSASSSMPCSRWNSAWPIAWLRQPWRTPVPRHPRLEYPASRRGEAPPPPPPASARSPVPRDDIAVVGQAVVGHRRRNLAEVFSPKTKTGTGVSVSSLLINRLGGENGNFSTRLDRDPEGAAPRKRPLRTGPLPALCRKAGDDGRVLRSGREL